MTPNRFEAPMRAYRAIAAAAAAGAIATLTPAPASAAPGWTPPVRYADGPITGSPQASLTGGGIPQGAWADAGGFHIASQPKLPGLPGAFTRGANASDPFYSVTGSGAAAGAWVSDGKLFAIKSTAGLGFSGDAIEQVSGGSTPVTEVDYARASNGTVAAAWRQDVNGVGQVFVAVAEPYQEFGEPRQISTGTTTDSDAGEPAVAVNEQGAIAIAWEQESATPDGLFTVARLRRETDDNGTLGPLQALSETGADASDVRMLLTGGTLHAAWERAGQVQLRTSPMYGSTLTPTVNLSPPGQSDNVVAAAELGRIIIAWTERDAASQPRVRVAANTASGLLVTHGQPLSPAGEPAARPAVAVTSSGAAVVAFEVADKVLAVRRPSGEGAWEAAETLATSISGPPSVAIAGGNTMVAWRDDAGAFVVSGYDSAAPFFVDTRFVARKGTAGKPTNACVSFDDDWGPLTATWQMGDGTTETGPCVNHAFANPGNYDATVTVTDAVGNSVSAKLPFEIAAAPVVTPPPPPVNAAPNTTLAKLAKSFRARSLRRFRGTAGDDAGLARVEVALLRGPRSRCAAMAASGAFRRLRPAAGKPCAPAKFLRAKGTTAWTFTLPKRLPAGTYTLWVRAVDTAGLADPTPAKATFKVRS